MARSKTTKRQSPSSRRSRKKNLAAPVVASDLPARLAELEMQQKRLAGLLHQTLTQLTTKLDRQFGLTKESPLTRGPHRHVFQYDASGRLADHSTWPLARN